MDNNVNVEEVAKGLSNFTYWNNFEATKQLLELFDIIKEKVNNNISIYKLETSNDYIKMYDDHFYTYQTWEELVDSEVDQSDGLTKKELEEELSNENGTVYQLPCGWYVQYV